MAIRVDTNPGETAVFDALLATFGPDVVTRERLDVADVHVQCQGVRFLIERKTWYALGGYAPQAPHSSRGAAGRGRYCRILRRLGAELELVRVDTGVDPAKF